MLSLVENLFVKKPLQDLPSSMNGLISTNDRAWILAVHVMLFSGSDSPLIGTGAFTFQTGQIAQSKVTIENMPLPVKEFSRQG